MTTRERGFPSVCTWRSRNRDVYYSERTTTHDNECHVDCIQAFILKSLFPLRACVVYLSRAMEHTIMISATYIAPQGNVTTYLVCFAQSAQKAITFREFIIFKRSRRLLICGIPVKMTLSEVVPPSREGFRRYLPSGLLTCWAIFIPYVPIKDSSLPE